MTTVFRTILCLLAITSVASANIRKIFDVAFEDIPGGGLSCSVEFHGQPPAPPVVDRIVRNALEAAVLADSSRDILAKAFINDDAMDDTHYSGELIYKASEKRIVTMDEYRGVKTSAEENAGYFVETKEDKTFEGIKPERRWLTLTVVFPEAPGSVDEAYQIAAQEAEKAARNGVDVNVFISVGDKAVRTSWRQMEDDAGGYVVAKYSAATRSVTKRDGTLLKKL